VKTSSNPPTCKPHLLYYAALILTSTPGGKTAEYEAQPAMVWESEAGQFYCEASEGETAIFKVDSEIWHDVSPSKPELGEDGKIRPRDKDDAVPYTIIVSFSYSLRKGLTGQGSMNENYHGPQFWYDFGEEEDMEVEE
jgi:hypothetical protein